MFSKAGFGRRFWYKYDDAHIATRLRDVFRGFLTDEDRRAGRTDITLGTAALRTLLLVVMRNATTDSPWPVSNNPRAKFNDPSHADCNLGIPLWQLVRASTAAPTYFPPEEVQLGPERYLFVDGGVTPYNNPALLLFVMASAPPYRLEWPAGPDRMLIVSVGTGRVRHARPGLRAADLNVLYNAAVIPNALLSATQVEQDLLCRTFGRCRKGDPIDQEAGSLIDLPGSDRAVPPLFTYLRYDADLSESGLTALGLPQLQPGFVQQLDAVDGIRGIAVDRGRGRPAGRGQRFCGIPGLATTGKAETATGSRRCPTGRPNGCLKGRPNGFRPRLPSGDLTVFGRAVRERRLLPSSTGCR